jgi:uncharacterized protein with PIN domain
MTEDPFFCENCNMELSHEDIETVSQVPRIDYETFEFAEEPADVYKCGGCGVILGYNPE